MFMFPQKRKEKSVTVASSPLYQLTTVCGGHTPIIPNKDAEVGRYPLEGGDGREKICISIYDKMYFDFTFIPFIKVQAILILL